MRLINSLRICDLISRQKLFLSRQVARSFYQPLNRPFDLGDAYDLWTGLFQSVILGAQPYLNVDIAHKAFPAPVSVLDVLQKFGIDPKRDLDNRQIDQLRRHFKGLCITYEPPGTRNSKTIYKFIDLKENARQHKFKNDKDNNKMITVEDYFRSKQWTIKYPHLPLLCVGNTIRDIRVPMEFCRVTPGQVKL